MMFRLVHEYLGDEELQRIAGISPGLPTSQAEIQGAYDFAVKLDVRELDSDYVIGKMKPIIDLLPIDTAGTVDRAKLMSIAVSMVDPVLGQSVMSDQRGASQKTFDKVNQDVALMALGNEAAYTENDSTAAMKMQFMEQIVQGNPKYQEALQGDELADGYYPDIAPLFLQNHPDTNRLADLDFVASELEFAAVLIDSKHCDIV